MFVDEKFASMNSNQNYEDCLKELKSFFDQKYLYFKSCMCVWINSLTLMLDCFVWKKRKRIKQSKNGGIKSQAHLRINSSQILSNRGVTFKSYLVKFIKCLFNVFSIFFSSKIVPKVTEMLKHKKRQNWKRNEKLTIILCLIDKFIKVNW